MEPTSPSDPLAKSRRRHTKLSYNFEQLTTAHRPFIYDLTLVMQSDGTLQVDCALTARSPEHVPQVNTRTASGVTVPVLTLFGMDWVSWSHACRVMNISRQFLNYRIMNDHHSVEVIRMDSESARQLGLFTGPESWPWQPVKKACHFILLGLDQLLKNDHIKPHARLAKSKDSEAESMSDADSAPETPTPARRKRRHSESEQVVPMDEPRILRRRSSAFAVHHPQDPYHDYSMEDPETTIQKAATRRKSFAARIRAQQSLEAAYLRFVEYVHREQSAVSTPTPPSQVQSPLPLTPATSLTDASASSPLNTSATPCYSPLLMPGSGQAASATSPEWESCKLAALSDVEDSNTIEQSVPQQCPCSQ